MKTHETAISIHARFPGVTFHAPDKVEIQDDVEIGPGTRVGTYAVLLSGSRIGRDCTIGTFVHIAGAVVGDGASIQTGAHITRYSCVGAGAFIGPGVMTTNDKHMDGRDLRGPRIEEGARIGAGAILLPVHVGRGAIVGAGAVVTKDVAANSTVAGIPARVRRHAEEF